MTKSLARILMLALTFLIAFVIEWTLTYPSGEPKNIVYVLWKYGLYGMNPDLATDTMIGDSNSEKLIVGMTRAQLRKRFGFLLTPAEVSPYLKACYLASAWNSKNVLFIRKSSWMVVFDGDKATELVLIKGC